MRDREHCLQVMHRMEEGYQNKDESFFINVINNEPSLVLRVHAVCMLAELGGTRSLSILSDILLNDPDPLVRHEAAFSLGQIGLSEANLALETAVKGDKEAIVRHEAAAALGSIGSQASRTTLQLALNDADELVRNSASTSLFNLDFLQIYPDNGSSRNRAPRP